MPSDDRSAVRRLSRAARPLAPAKQPYYMHNPRPGIERFGPGWYWTPAGAEAPMYLAYNSDAALVALHLLAADVVGDDQAADEPGVVFELRPRIAA